jgi:hypothetical protein
VSIDPATRRAAYIATAVTLPIFVVVALLLGNASGSDTKAKSAAPLPPISLAPPPANPAADAACTALLGVLPVDISTSNGAISARPVHSTSPYVEAWGNPAIVMRCGVPRPKQLTINSGALLILIDGVNFLPVKQGKVTAYTSVDRSAYVEISVPASYTEPPISPIADAIGHAMKQVCTVPDENGVVDPPTASLCTHRK